MFTRDLYPHRHPDPRPLPASRDPRHLNILFLSRNCRMCLPNMLFPVLMFAFIFRCRSFSPYWPLAFLIVSQPLWIFKFFFLQNSPLLFSITRSSSFSVIHVSVNIKNNVEKDTTLLLFFRSPGGHAISFQIKPWVAFGLPYLLIELFYIGIPEVRTVGRSMYGHMITKFSWMGGLQHLFLPMVLRCARFARESCAINYRWFSQWRHLIVKSK